MERNKGFQYYFERVAVAFCALLLVFLVMRGYILPRITGNWSYIRGPLAPIEYYRLGLLDQPVDFQKHYPYIPAMEVAPATGQSQSPKPTDAVPAQVPDFPKDSTVPADNRDKTE